MRFNFELNIKEIPLNELALTTAKTLHALLGTNNKWHDLERKPFSCSFIKGGKVYDGIIKFEDKPILTINTEDVEIITQLMTNKLPFSIETPKVFKGYNLLSVKNVVYNSGGKKNWITTDNQDAYIKHIITKYALKEVEILKIKNSVITYKEGKKIPVSDLLIRINSDQNVANLFETGIGGSCSLGFGFVEPLNK